MDAPVIETVDAGIVLKADDITANQLSVNGAATVDGVLTAKGGLGGDQGKIDLSGSSLVDCRTISELFQGGRARFDGIKHYAEIPDPDDLIPIRFYK